jgi:glycyl-tRNA synthetase beta chain
MREFLLEILSEDIPARMQVQAADDLKRLVTEHLTAAGVTFDTAAAHSTPRRLALVIEGLPERSPDRTEERKGPKVGSPDGAIQGFLKGAGLTSIDQAEIRDTDKGQAYFAVSKIAGENVESLLVKAVVDAVDQLPWSKSMRWGKSKRRWVRPLHQILALVDGHSIASSITNSLNLVNMQVGAWTPETAIPAEPSQGIRPSETTVGHRFLGPECFSVSSFADYERKLLDHKVVLDREKRKWRIQGDAKRIAELHGLVVALDEPLLEEVAGLVEWPVVLMGSIDNAFMDLPPEVRRTTMRANQKYFTLEHPDGKPAAKFLIVANMETDDSGDEIVAGNERVLRARLSDARFFYDQDRKTKLADQRPKLAKIAFHAKLGSVLERVERLEMLAVEIAKYVPRAKPTMALEAARLCKCDLVSGMVGEFPELQGLMGRYYALDEGAPQQVADAIRDHYKPLGPNDACPTEPVSVALALAEKIDTLVGFFAIGELPTGSKDPFALRRAALGVIRLVLENGLRLPLVTLISLARGPFKIAPLVTSTEEMIILRNQLFSFLADRLKVVLKERGIRHDLIDAVYALSSTGDLVNIVKRVEALDAFLATDDGANLLIAYRRAANILRIEEKKMGHAIGGQVDPKQFIQAEETALADALTTADAQVEPFATQEDFQGAMAKYAALRPAVDAFFDKVTVNAEEADIRANRLRLLSRIRGTLNKIADFSRIV